MKAEPDPDPAVAEFSPVENEAPLRWWRALRLAPADGLGCTRRAVLAVIVTWVPIMAWAFATGRLPAPEGNESILRHFGVHVRCLLAIPLLIAGEALLHRGMGRIAGRLVAAGIVPPERRAAYDAMVESLRRLRDATLPWIGVVVLAMATIFLRRTNLHDDSVAWALDPNGGLGFGGWWFVHVVRPFYLALAFGWLWRLGLVTLWFWRLSRLELALVPAHPDRMGGLGIVQRVPSSFTPLTLALSSVLSGAWAHRVMSHGVHVRDLAVEAAMFAVVWSATLLLPLLVLMPLLSRTRRAAIPAYGALVGEQGRLAHRKWILREDVGEPPVLAAPEIGPIADAAAMYEQVVAMQTVPIGKQTLIATLAPIAVPFLFVVALEIPISELLQRLLGVLV